jgi:hypothetical protein
MSGTWGSRRGFYRSCVLSHVSEQVSSGRERQLADAAKFQISTFRMFLSAMVPKTVLPNKLCVAYFARQALVGVYAHVFLQSSRVAVLLAADTTGVHHLSLIPGGTITASFWTASCLRRGGGEAGLCIRKRVILRISGFQRIHIRGMRLEVFHERVHVYKGCTTHTAGGHLWSCLAFSRVIDGWNSLNHVSRVVNGWYLWD